MLRTNERTDKAEFIGPFVLKPCFQKWIEVYDQFGTAENRYKPSKQIKFKTPILRSDLCDYSDAHTVVVKGDITVLRGNNDAYEKK